MSSEERKTVRVKPSRDAQVEEMIADPDAYFAKIAKRAREEAELHVARRAMQAMPSPRRRFGSLYLRFPFSERRQVKISVTTPLTVGEFDYLIQALRDLRPAFVAKHDGSPAPEGNAASELLRANAQDRPA